MKLFYEEMGEGFPIILIHGFPFDHTTFKETAEILKNRARVVLPDLRGFGRSPVAGQVVSLQEMANDIRDLMDRLGIEKAILAGHSMGGYLGVQFCRTWPERIAGLAFIASHAASDTQEARQGRFMNIEKIHRGRAREFLLEGMLPKLTKFPDIQTSLGVLLVKTPDEVLVGCLQSMAERMDATQWMKDSGIPVAMIFGEQDMIMPVARADEMANKMGADPVIRVPGAGHMLMMENPGMAAQGIQNFLERILSS